MTRSFLNKTVGVKGKALFCTTLAALCATLLFVVCDSSDEPTPPGPGPNPGTTFTLNATVNPANTGSITKNPNKATYNQGETVTLTASAAYGYQFVNWSNGQTSQSITVTMNSNITLVANFMDPAEDPCDPATFNQDVCCAVVPSTPGCQQNPCITNPGSTACCTANQNHSSCQTSDPCNPWTQACCSTPAGASHPNCQQGGTQHIISITISPAGAGQVSKTPDMDSYLEGQSVLLTATPASSYTFSHWTGTTSGASANLTLTMNQNYMLTAHFTTSGGGDPCVTNPGSTACCSVNANHSSCQGTGTGKFCRWDNDPANCWGIGGPYDDTKTEAECLAASGEVVSDCNAVSTLQYCRWDTGCFPITDPNGQSTDNPGMTNLENCNKYGFLSNLPDCSDYVAPTEEHYCWWPSSTGGGCNKITQPNVVDPNSDKGLTYLENCKQNGKHFDSKAACDAYTPPAVNYYCDWSTAGKSDCWNIGDGTAACDAGADCVGTTKMSHCEGTGKVITCSGTDRPWDGTCCAH
ncbi:MAG: hypothetical protein FWB85_01675 [Chitinispirillia bacterium]|nr:hypothetical protein [Chitinispirillia bacterium]MCL2241136.1 hypothetical protein [Chitinispirillia bacterium]